VVLMFTGYADYQAVLSPSASIRYLHALLWGSAAALVVAGCVFLEKSGASTRFFRNRILLLLGDASYSIYLFHLIVFGWIAAIYLRLGFFLNTDVMIPVHAVIAVAASLLFYKWVEKPLLNLLRSTPPRAPHQPPTPPRPAKP
jgi:exopolysaccharide production protein ExoZ